MEELVDLSKPKQIPPKSPIVGDESRASLFRFNSDEGYREHFSVVRYLKNSENLKVITQSADKIFFTKFVD